MKSRCFLLTLFAVVFAPGLLHAQQANPNVKTRPWGLEVKVTLSDALAVQNEKMYEDIEIMRRILDRKLHGLYPSHTYQTFGMVGMQARGGGLGEMGGMRGMQGGMGMAGGMMPVAVPLRSLEGVYLKGQGVVYTATLKSLQPLAKADSDSGYKEFLSSAVVLRESEWDSIRRQVRNEKEKPKKPEESKPPSLSNVLLKMLADNGHHFSQLGEDERLTIVLTVHEESPSSPTAKSGTGSAEAASNPTPRDIDADVAREARHFEVLGELYLKQAKYHEALMLFQRWLERTESPKQEADVRRKLAQCYLMQGQDEKARTELDKAIELLKKGKEAKENPTAAKPAAALPVKLIISAPKKLLDQVKAGKITFEEFRRQANVETLRFGDRR